MRHAIRRRGPSPLSAGLGLLTGTLLSLTAPVEATHSVDHRYAVLGYVRDARDRSVVGAVVRVVREKTGLSYAGETDTEGFYVVIVHLHDEDLLDRLRVSLGSMTIHVEARFEPGNARDHRGTRVDFVGQKAREWRAAFPSSLEKYLRQ